MTGRLNCPKAVYNLVSNLKCCSTPAVIHSYDRLQGYCSAHPHSPAIPTCWVPIAIHLPKTIQLAVAGMNQLGLASLLLPSHPASKEFASLQLSSYPRTCRTPPAPEPRNTQLTFLVLFEESCSCYNCLSLNTRCLHSKRISKNNLLGSCVLSSNLILKEILSNRSHVTIRLSVIKLLSSV